MAKAVQVIISNIINKIDRPYDYIYPFDDDPIGKRVIVPFGKSNAPRKGLVMGISQNDELQSLKKIYDVLDQQPIVSSEQIQLIHFLKEHYFISFYRALNCMIPAGMDFKVQKTYCLTGNMVPEKYSQLAEYIGGCKKSPTLDQIPAKYREQLLSALEDGVLAEQIQSKRNLGDLADKMLTLAVSVEHAETYIQNLSARFEGQKELLGLLINQPNISAKEAIYMTGCSASTIHTLSKRGMIHIYFESRARTPYADFQKKYDQRDIVLNDQQQLVYENIVNQLDHGRQTHLIHGITGSGKTHVYMKLIDRVMNDHKSVLFLVPEISLTPQTLSRFYERYGDKVAVIHSGLSMGQRMDEWKKIKNSHTSLVVGTRSAVFAPINHLGMIIMDEEHESSYKSESAPKYHAREVASFLCAQKEIPLILGSATPSLESYRSAQIGKYTLHTITSRYNTLPLPEVEMVDMRSEIQEGNVSFLSDSLKEQLIQTIEQKKQAILFLNRRGAHTAVMCRKCGYVLKCPSCDIAMTYHMANDRCMCHFCSYSVKMMDHCPACGEKHIKMMGFGTQLVEKQISQIIPDVRVLRMDMDTVHNYVSYQTMLSDFAVGKYDILLGTQMVAKGLNLPNVTLVGVLQADMSLYIDDFRAGERTFSLLTQVCGRSGRADQAGKAVIQSYCPDHDVLVYARKQDYLSFYDYEIQFRKAINYPPFCDIALFLISASTHELAYSAASALFSAMEQHAKGDASDIPLRLLRPSVPRIAKINEKYRMQMMVKCRNSQKFRKLAQICMDEITKEYNVQVSIDINPLSF